jgi:anti-sigma regulatory factor (Ser/Thr protein kinase)
LLTEFGHERRPPLLERGELNSELFQLAVDSLQATAEQQQAAIRLRLSSDSARVLVEVWDADPQPPAPNDLGEGGTPDPEEEGGRGLFLVAALSARWDWYLTEDPEGKVVWYEIEASWGD